MNESDHTNDHDLLIELRTEMRGLRVEIKEMRENTLRRLEIVEKEKISLRDLENHIKNDDILHKEQNETLNDHESRIRRIEYVSFIGIGGLLVLQIIFKILMK